MPYNFKSIADVKVVNEPSDSANVLIEENGEIKKAPKTAVGGGNTEWDAVIECDISGGDSRFVSGSYNTIYRKILALEVPRVKILLHNEYYGDWYGVLLADVMYNVHDDNALVIIFRDNGTYTNSYHRLFVHSDGEMGW